MILMLGGRMLGERFGEEEEEEEEICGDIMVFEGGFALGMNMGKHQGMDKGRHWGNNIRRCMSVAAFRFESL